MIEIPMDSCSDNINTVASMIIKLAKSNNQITGY